jgi:hypothetical protein
MSNCPCCSNQMQRHIRSRQIYWFCRHCWQEMPNLDSDRVGLLLSHHRAGYSTEGAELKKLFF